MQAHFVVAEMNRRHVVEDVDRRRLPELEAEHRALLLRGVIEKEVIVVQIHRRIERILRRAHAGDVVDVRVRQQDVLNLEIVIAHGAPAGRRLRRQDR